MGGCEGGAAGTTVYVPGPTSVSGTTTEITITYVTTCLETQTITLPGKTYTTTLTTVREIPKLS